MPDWTSLRGEKYCLRFMMSSRRGGASSLLRRVRPNRALDDQWLEKGSESTRSTGRCGRLIAERPSGPAFTSCLGLRSCC